MKIVVLDGHALNPGDLSWDAIAALGELRVYDITLPDQVIGRIGDAEVVFTNKVNITREVMEACPGMKCVIVTATGYNMVDIAAAREKGVTVCNAPGYSTGAVAQMAMGFLLETAIHIGEHNRAVHAGRWAECGDFCFWDYPVVELEGKTLGIFGCGSIGRRVARLANAFGMRVLGYSRNAVPGTAEDGITFVGKDELFAKSEYLTFHCPLNQESQGIICRETIEKLPQGAVVINTARGGLTVEADVAEALRSGRLGAYCTDAAAVEPLPADSPLLGAPNCIITPHIGWASLEARGRLMDINAANLRAYLAGAPINVVS